MLLKAKRAQCIFELVPHALLKHSLYSFREQLNAALTVRGHFNQFLGLVMTTIEQDRSALTSLRLHVL